MTTMVNSITKIITKSIEIENDSGTCTITLDKDGDLEFQLNGEQFYMSPREWAEFSNAVSSILPTDSNDDE